MTVATLWIGRTTPKTGSNGQIWKNHLLNAYLCSSCGPGCKSLSPRRGRVFVRAPHVPHSVFVCLSLGVVDVLFVFVLNSRFVTCPKIPVLIFTCCFVLWMCAFGATGLAAGTIHRT